MMNFNSVAGLWKIEGQRIELATDAGVLFVDVPHVLTAPSDQLVTNEPPALADETPLLTIGVTQAGRPVWLQPLEDLDAGRLTVRYLVAPPGQMLGRADSEHVFASGAEGVSWAARR